MEKQKRSPKRERASESKLAASRSAYPPEDSVGHLVRWTHRALQRELEERLRPYGISNGMWYFLRVLWDEDGLSQRELSERVGTTEPTTVSALHAMEKRGLAVRVPNASDRRKSNIYLTRPAKDLRDLLLGEARTVNKKATAGISAAEIAAFKTTIEKIRKNLTVAQDERREMALRPGGKAA